MAKSFNYGQKFPRRVIANSSLERFLWSFFTIDTEYKEPFGHVNLTSPSGQSYVPDQTGRPIRLFNLTFNGMVLHEENPENCLIDINFNLLYAFYQKHGTHKHFIFEHPVYGDLVVRFAKPLSIPKKNPNGLGSLHSFDVVFMEMIDTHYMFSKTEDLTGYLPFHAGFFDVEVDTVEDTLVAPLGNNYEMIFKRARKPLRTIKVSVQGLKYFLDSEDGLDPGYFPASNMLLLELFYLKHRLRNRFVFSYMGEDIFVRFKEPIKIPKVQGNTGVIGTTELVFIETPYKSLTEPSDLKMEK